jgi:DNA-binding HxlR family transcriptional regulator
MQRDVKAGSWGHAPVLTERHEGVHGRRRRARAAAGDSAQSNGGGAALQVSETYRGNGVQPLERARVPRDWAMTRALELVGMRWNLLIISELGAGIHRFTELERNIGIPRRTLALRLRRLTADGLVEHRAPRTDKRPYGQYFLTELGEDLQPAIEALQKWGERNYQDLAEALLSSA